MLLVVVGLLASAHSTPAPSVATCERAPPHAQPADRHYKLSIAGDPDLYLPGELYTVSLHGVDSGEGPTPFTAFTIWAEIYKQHNENDSKAINDTVNTTNQSLGVFQAYDAQTKLYEDCKPAIGNATAHPKTEIQVIWTAPKTTLDGCIRLCARAFLAKPKNGLEERSWSVLARKLCPAPAATVTGNRQTPIVEPCCACDEAKYEVTFEGLWSRNTHPRDFPPEAARAHFGDVIGASHTAQYRVWQEGRSASTGLRRLADDGATTALEKELKEESDHIRTIIKARGISWQQVSSGGIPSTFAVFRVDAKHHLMSLAAKLAPSPDWIVGVSALELCNANCTWTRSATLPLYPYDAGTDSGLSYTARRQPTSPPAPVRALRPDWPRDPRSPFYNQAGEMRPFARLRLSRLRLYEKSCEPTEPIGEPIPEAGGGSCATQAWGQWGPCSTTCGPGRAARQRHYIWPARALTDGCRATLTEYRHCNGPRAHCRLISEYEAEPAESHGPCAVSSWSEWSPCEGCGVRARTRHYVVPRARKRCHVGYRARTVLSQAIPCAAGPCNKPTGKFVNATNFDWFFVDDPSCECEVSGWGEWSPCSARCGRGRRVRSRLYVAQDSRVQRHLTRRLLHEWNQRFAHIQDLESATLNMTAEDPEVERLVQERLEQCQLTLTQQEALCDGDGDCQQVGKPQDICSLPAAVGPCRGYEERWFYDKARGSCEPFGFTGCGGNTNNFRTRDMCQRHCQRPRNATVKAQPVNVETILSKKLKPTPSREDNEVMVNDRPALVNVDCETGPWLGWSDCVGDCDYAIKLNYRVIVQTGSGMGRPCQKLIKSRTCRPGHCRRLFAFTNKTSLE
ncbi:PREDICTED: spondin-1-like [Papilio xuthus]|uniref:Spondin-1 n=1 Tax=Papilio xuthus TaxID=66420 RepID=A0AAJ7EF25_PAPXU|nr:PREDICTED: spondin-1-like [Papilio xuthus]